MHAYLWTMFVIQVFGILCGIGNLLPANQSKATQTKVAQPKATKNLNFYCLLGNIALLVWTSHFLFT